MGNSFSASERKLMLLFESADFFEYKGHKYVVRLIGKPTTSHGEPKTDLYIFADCSENNDSIELKISYKQENADFLENKMSSDRAYQIFGENWSQIIIESTTSIKEQFADRKKIFIEDEGRVKAGSITLGWKFEIMNKLSGNLSGKMKLTHDQTIDVLSGTNLPESKKNSQVNGKVISNSGVANYILDINITEDTSLTHILNKLLSIDDYANKFEGFYFACKALNYRYIDDKWDGDRPLAVYVEWSIKDQKLKPTLVFSEPLVIKGNSRALSMKSIISNNKDLF